MRGICGPIRGRVARAFHPGEIDRDHHAVVFVHQAVAMHDRRSGEVVRLHEHALIFDVGIEESVVPVAALEPLVLPFVLRFNFGVDLCELEPG